MHSLLETIMYIVRVWYFEERQAALQQNRQHLRWLRCVRFLLFDTCLDLVFLFCQQWSFFKVPVGLALGLARSKCSMAGVCVDLASDANFGFIEPARIHQGWQTILNPGKEAGCLKRMTLQAHGHGRSTPRSSCILVL